LVRARACIKCREYIIIHVDESKNMENIKVFDGKHRGHTLITLDLDEVKDTYSVYDTGEVSE